jgi:hypothetical protein
LPPPSRRHSRLSNGRLRSGACRTREYPRARGLTIGKTDDLGYRVVEDPIQVHATTPRLIYRYQGSDFRLTDVHGHVVEKLLA